MEKPKFIYQISDDDYSIVTICKYDENTVIVEDDYLHCVFEDELKKHIEKYPHCKSFRLDDEGEAEADRLFSLYGLEKM